MIPQVQLWKAGMLGLLLSVPAHAQHWSFQTFGPEQGLTNSTILVVKQDSQGFLWVSTEGGLFRYDGDRFRPFLAERADKKGTVDCLYNSADGQLWAGSVAGLFRWNGRGFDPVPGFEELELDNRQSITGDASNLYIATSNGVLALPLKGGPARVISTRPATAVFLASDGTLWFSCGNVLCSIREDRQQEWGPAKGVSEGPWRAILEDGAKRVWIRSADKVLVREAGASNFHAVRNVQKLYSTRGVVLIADASGHIMIPHGTGLVVCDGEDCSDHGPEGGLRKAEVYSALEDREGSLWIGYAGLGLERRLGRQQWQSYNELEGITNSEVWRVERDAFGNLWAGTNRGLFEGRQRNGRWRFERSKVVGELTVYGLLAESDGSLWIGLFQTEANGLIRYYPRTGKKIVYPPASPTARLKVSDIDRDPGGTIWVATATGLLRLTPGAKKLDTYPTPLDGAFVSDVATHHRDLFVSGRKGLFVERGDWRRLITVKDGLKDNFVQSVTAGPEGELWLSYFSAQGITRIDFRGERFQMRHFTRDNGLPGNVVFSQFFDARGRHWIGTDNGVAVLEGGRWITYDTSDGLVWNDCNAHAFLAEPNGTVWFGTSNGLSGVTPALPRRPIQVDTVITGITRNDQPAEGTDFDSTTHLLAVRFTMLSYERPRPRFRYRIGGESSPWVETRSHEVRFAELPAGRYRFEVQGKTPSGVWSRPAVLEFRLRPPWSESWPVRTSLAVLAAGLLWWWWHQRESRQGAIREQLEAAVAARTRDLVAATARAQEATRAKSEFLANMSHEIRTPMNGVLGMTDLLVESGLNVEQLDYARLVKVSAESLLTLIDDILDFSKIEAGKMELESVAFPLRGTVAPVVKTLALRAHQKGLELRCDIQPDVPENVVGAPNRLRQVITNLLGNAIKFTDRGEVSLEIALESQTVDHAGLRFTVRDTGVGIAADKQKVIFDAFAQADGSTARQFGGTGLGLSISKALVQIMGGEIWVESTLGQGSAFHFTVALGVEAAVGRHRPDDAGSPANTMPAAPAAKGRTLRVLLAEDNPINKKLAAALLEKAGHRVSVASNGQEALARIEEELFDVVLMDVQMPEMDGFEAVAAIRTRERAAGGHVPIIAMTAHAMKGDRERCLAAGMDEYISKPIHPQELHRLLAHVTTEFPKETVV